MASYCRVCHPITVFPDAQQQQEDDLDLSPDDEEEEAETGVGGEEEEDPYEYDELPLVPLGGENNSPGPNSLNDDLILEGKQHRGKGVPIGLVQTTALIIFSSYTELNTFVHARTGCCCTL